MLVLLGWIFGIFSSCASVNFKEIEVKKNAKSISLTPLKPPNPSCVIHAAMAACTVGAVNHFSWLS
jgi:hypothetical protein